MIRTILISSLLALTCVCFTGCGGDSGTADSENVQVDKKGQAEREAQKENPIVAPGKGSKTGTMSGGRGD